MVRHKWVILVSLLCAPVMAAVLLVDLAGVFGYSDLPFLLVFLVYLLMVFIQRSQSKLSFGIVLILLLYMGLSYIPTGASQTTERLGEWFFLFFVLGLVQYVRESWKKKNQSLA